MEQLISLNESAIRPLRRRLGRFDGDDDRVMLVLRNDLFTRPECGEAAIPQIAV
ncbi:MAG: hypothetical protein AB7H81_01910 [Vicinamibacterales bacterium]|jgi:hypothetical protein